MIWKVWNEYKFAVDVFNQDFISIEIFKNFLNVTSEKNSYGICHTLWF